MMGGAFITQAPAPVIPSAAAQDSQMCFPPPPAPSALAPALKWFSVGRPQLSFHTHNQSMPPLPQSTVSLAHAGQGSNLPQQT